MSKKQKEKKDSKPSIFIIILLFVSLFSSIFCIYEIFLLNSIEDLIRYIIIGILCIIDLVLLFMLPKIKKFKKKKKNILTVLLIIYLIISLSVGLVINYIYGELSHVNKEYVVYTSDLIVMNSRVDVQDIKDIKDMSIGILGDKDSVEGNIIPREIIKNNYLEDDNQIEEYDDYTTMLVDLYSNEIGAMFISSNYVSMFSEISGYENIENDVRVITSQDKKMKKSATSNIETASVGKSITEPFTVLLMGIDSTDDILTKNAVANGDTLILITFNPNTLNATMLSIPRDSYIPISCWSGKPENKITHAAAYGNDCMINTIQDYFDVNIDYYAKINFKGLVKLVNAVGGVEVDVEQELCTDNSNRENTVCIHPGHQVLMGEEALVFARNRKQLANGDFGRARHQQEIVMALVNKMKSIRDVTTFMDILNTISNNLDTNLTTKQILSFYNVGKDIIKKSLSSEEADLINIQQLFLDGTGQMIFDERAKMVLWDYVPNKNSKKDIIEAMKVNLELSEHKDITEFHFSINEPYEKEIIGEGPYNTTSTYTLLPDFTGDTMEQARSAASKLGISVSFSGNGGTVIKQSYPANKRVDLIKGSVQLTLSGSTKTNNTINKKDDDEEDFKYKNRNNNNRNYNDDDDDDEDEIEDTTIIKEQPTEEDETDTSNSIPIDSTD